MPGRAGQCLPLLQRRSVQRHDEAVRHLEVSVFAPPELRGRIRPEPGAVQLDTGGVLRFHGHTVRVSARNI